MRIEDRIRVEPFDRVAAMIRLHQRSLEKAAARRERAEARRVRCPQDRTNCRIRLQAAQREISILRRGLSRVGDNRSADCPSTSNRSAAAIHATTSPPTDYKSYAPAPIGQPARNREAPDVQPPPIILNHPRVTNLGTLLDALA